MLSALRKNAVTGSAGIEKDDGGLFSSVFGNRAKDKSGKYRYQIDISQAFPTSEQFDLIKSYAQGTPYSAEAFLSAFPRVKDDPQGVKKLSAIGYDTILGEAAFETDGTPKSLEDLAKEGLFQAPLAVDWEHKLLASNTEHLKKLLEAYGVK